jgi:quercetin dioxygenase-like cupin family protein/DNA-binding XRE family transcriptional regulator
MKAERTPGERIAELCKTYSVSREILAERSGVSVELIRRIEEEGYIPDLAPLLKLSRALGVRLGTLLDDREELGPVVTLRGHAGEMSRFITGGQPEGDHQGLIFRAMAADKSGRHMEPFIVDIESGARQDNSSHEGEEFIYVLSGKIHIDYGKDSYDLGEGDSIYYDSIVPHRVLSGADSPAKILAVIYTPA